MQYIDINEVSNMTCVKKTFIYKAIKEGKFPKQLHLGKSSLWVRDEILEFMRSKAEERSSAA